MRSNGLTHKVFANPDGISPGRGLEVSLRNSSLALANAEAVRGWEIADVHLQHVKR